MSEIAEAVNIDMALDGVSAAVLYYHNVGPEDQLNALFPGATDDYRSKKLSLFHNNFTLLWGLLDSAHRRQYIGLAMEKYGDEVTRRRRSAEAD